MNPTIVGVVGIAIMILIFFSRMPVAYVMTMIGFLGFSLMISLKGGLNLLSRNIYEVFSSYGLTTIPLFILMGQLAFNSGISRRLYDTAYKFLGSTRGGAGHGNGIRLHGLRRCLRFQSGHRGHHGHRRIAGDEAL